MKNISGLQNREVNPSQPNSKPWSWGTLLSYAAPYSATLHPTAIWCTHFATLHSCEPSCTFLSYAASSWATVPHSELHYITSHWAMLHPTELRCIHWATLRPSKLRYKPLSYAASSELRCMLCMSWAALQLGCLPNNCRNAGLSAFCGRSGTRI